jgi:hypothetical protein
MYADWFRQVQHPIVQLAIRQDRQLGLAPPLFFFLLRLPRALRLALSVPLDLLFELTLQLGLADALVFPLSLELLLFGLYD